jgi:hypothetical protein
MQAFTPALECEALASLLKAVASQRIPKRNYTEKTAMVLQSEAGYI